VNATRFGVLILTIALCAWSYAQPSPRLQGEIDFFISNMVERHGFDAGALRELFSTLKAPPAIVKAISAPATAKPWHEFRPLFVDQNRINGGIKFWNDNAKILTRARETYHIPEAIIVAIVGIETRFGKFVGSHRVVDALYTLGFELPGRTEFFRGEMEAFLLLSREQGWDPRSIKGSYAGAMGMPQFMPSSYRNYGVDFSGDGKVDLWSDPADVIASVANFLSSFGWKESEPVTVPARFNGIDAQPLLSLGMKPHSPIQTLKERGMVPLGQVDEQLIASVFTLDLIDGPEYWLGLNNFHTILHYNRSRNYAMSVYQLALEIARERERLAALESAPAAPLIPR